MPFYDNLATRWDALTGFEGGPLKRYVLNDALCLAIRSVEDRAILELGSGNGYFIRLLLRRMSGQRPRRLVLTDVSPEQLARARAKTASSGAEYRILDVRRRFDFPDGCFDLVVASMVFNEIPQRNLHGSFAECHRVSSGGAQLLLAVVHPDFVAELSRRGQLRRLHGSIFTMPGAKELRVPVAKTSRHAYSRALERAGYEVRAHDIYASQEVLNERPGLRASAKGPLALVLDCRALGKAP